MSNISSKSLPSDDNKISGLWSGNRRQLCFISWWFEPWETNFVTTWRLSPLYLDFIFSSRIFVQLIQNVQSYTHCCSERRIVIVIVTHNIGDDHGLHSLSNVTLSPSNLVTTALLLSFWRSRHSWSNKLLRFNCEEQRPLNKYDCFQDMHTFKQQEVESMSTQSRGQGRIHKNYPK